MSQLSESSPSSDFLAAFRELPELKKEAKELMVNMQHNEQY